VRVAIPIEPGEAAGFGFRVHGEPIDYSAREKKISCLGASADLEPSAGRIELRILADRTSLEVFGNGGRVSITSCFIPRARKRSLEIYASAGPIKIPSLKVYLLRSAWTPARPSAPGGRGG